MINRKYEWRVDHDPSNGVSNFSVFDMSRPLGGGPNTRMFRNILHAEVNTENPDSHQVMYLGGDYEGRAHLGTMLGLIHRHAQQEGKSIRVDPSDVSKHSLKLVNNLVDRGLVPESSRPQKKVKLNQDSFVGDRWEFARAIGERIPNEELSSAKKHTFNLLRSNPKPRSIESEGKNR